MTARSELVRLSRRLGEPSRNLVVASEGNTSMRLAGSSMLVKASGCALESLVETDLLEVDRDVLLRLIDEDVPSDERTATVYRQAVLSADRRARMPSVEAILHAVIYAETDAHVVAHTHPVAVNALLCSTAPQLLVEGVLFPDHVVVLGRRQMLIPYVDPGLPLALAVQRGLRDFLTDYGSTPRVIYLVNHGLFVLAGSCGEAESITAMAVKVARILLGTMGAGGPAFITDEQAARIEGRPDEQYRRAILHPEGT